VCVRLLDGDWSIHVLVGVWQIKVIVVIAGWRCLIFCNLDTRQRNNLYLSQANLTIYQKGAYYSGIEIFNKLPLEINP
jgi:hypothetical protein